MHEAPDSTWCAEEPDGVRLELLVQPKASRERVGPVVGDRLKVAVKAPPVDGAANAALVKLLAKRCGVRRGDVTLRAGQSGRRKTVFIRGLSVSALMQKVTP